MLILFELGEEGYSKPIRTGNTFSRNYIVYEVMEIKIIYYQFKNIMTIFE